MKLIFVVIVCAAVFLICFLIPFYCPDQDSLRCVFHIDKFQYLCFIPLALQILCPESVRDQRRHTFLQQSIS